MGYKRGVATYRTKSPHRRADASGKKSCGAKLQLAGADEGSGHVFKYRRGEKAVRANAHIRRIEIWGTRFCGFNLNIGPQRCPVLDDKERLWTVSEDGLGICHT